MKYKYLNEVLLNWNSEEIIHDNSIIKAPDIKKEISDCFIYKIEDKPSRIKIFDDGTRDGWPKYRTYKDKVYINGKHVELKSGETIDKFEPGEYRVYIEDIDQITNCQCMFYECKQLISVPMFDVSNVLSMESMFAFCYNLISVPLFNTVKVEDMGEMFRSCIHLVDVPLFSPLKQVKNMDKMFWNCPKLSVETKSYFLWGQKYNFKKHKKI